MKNTEVFVQQIGIMPYAEAWAYQEKLFQKVIDQKLENRDAQSQNPTENYLIFCQHPHVYTLGKSGKDSHLLIDEQKLKEIEATYFQINRGGDITYHGFGQVVAYPILDLDNFFTDIHKYLRFMEEAVIKTLADYSILASRIDKLTGVWIGANTENPRKICAIGVKTSRWVTMHGFALNVNTDLSYFQHIVPCGITDKAVTSMQKELGKTLIISEVEQKLMFHLAELFGMKLKHVVNF
ncbi:MAG: lipoyl(octanoyl) transferase LipB [Bacteroidetes bacterium]|nr:MAG: lipoyl(octanoyl) transferase LipB [Bacteroidota bacterium]